MVMKHRKKMFDDCSKLREPSEKFSYTKSKPTQKNSKKRRRNKKVFVHPQPTTTLTAPNKCRKSCLAPSLRTSTS